MFWLNITGDVFVLRMLQNAKCIYFHQTVTLLK
jgi:hypothetical protein